ncbi:hypothetical protein L1987_31491 [Smallanthus sonchifolius]|uniref:Uncharacterized protein n=1 Tax=Smallanthus sonchifolius TaxID=185202 RepID=A0ACB9I5S8_9ASTR|nr:hypothetical protein L1987_31491 [Smallanthus sonchifolius]
MAIPVSEATANGGNSGSGSATGSSTSDIDYENNYRRVREASTDPSSSFQKRPLPPLLSASNLDSVFSSLPFLRQPATKAAYVIAAAMDLYQFDGRSLTFYYDWVAFMFRYSFMFKVVRRMERPEN